jgi:DNA replicative helicase MCM subunit Mcm2 (Cdc46/Mcm family)
MERGYCDFNKLGIRQKIRTKARFILGSNPITLTWKNTDSVDKNELPIKLTLVDRLDIIHIFRDVMGDEATREWSAKMFELALKHINTDYLFLRKYIHYICTEPKFREFKFESKELAQRLSDLWTEIKITYPTLVSKRGYQSIFRIASAVARLLCKETIDSEVIEQTVNYIKAMYHEFGAQVIDKSVDRPQVIFVEICEVITNYAKGLEYIMSDDESSTNISFKEAAQTACDKNPDIRDYFGVRKRDNGRLQNISHNIRLRSMHDKFDELGSRGDGIAYSNGKIKVIENKPNVGLILRWVADSNSNSNSNSNPGSTRPRTDDAKQL